MGDRFVIIVFGISMFLAVAWIIATAVQNIKKRRALEDDILKQEQEKRQRELFEEETEGQDHNDEI